MTKRAHLLNLTLSPSPHAPEASDAPDAHLNGHCQYLTELDIIGVRPLPTPPMPPKLI